MSAPELDRITRHAGIAGQYAYSVRVTYGDYGSATVTFTGDVYGGPIVMDTGYGNGGVFVDSRVLDRIGRTLSPEWVRAFFTPVSTVL